MTHDNETAIKAGEFMVIAHGTREEVAWTQDIFRTNGVATLALRERSAVFAENKDNKCAVGLARR